jgi:hypothetical protein
MKDSNFGDVASESKHSDLPHGDTDAGGGTLSMDETFELLKNNRRRLVLEYLIREDEEAKLDVLADHVTAIENDTDVDSITSEERKRVYVALYQFHLPKMSDMGVINYDKDRGNISLTDRGRELHHERERHSGPPRRWYLAYLGVACVGIVGTLVSALFWNPALAIGWLGGETVLLVILALADASASGNSII